MKHVTGILFEEGDYVLVTTGYQKGKLGIVIKHYEPADHVDYDLVDGSNSGYLDPKNLKYLTKEEAEVLMDKMKVLKVSSCDEVIEVNTNYISVGCQDITFPDALKIAAFITKHCVTVKKKVVAKKVVKKTTKKR